MSKYELLVKAKKHLMDNIKEIELEFEGIGNENSTRTINEFSLKMAKLKTEINAVNRDLEQKRKDLDYLEQQVCKYSGKGIERILNAIAEQRWYFFKNNPKILMDRDTGIVWPNPDYFKYVNPNSRAFELGEIYEKLNSLNIYGFTKWELPRKQDYDKLLDDKTFPFYTGGDMEILNSSGIILEKEGVACYCWADEDYPDDKTLGFDVFLPLSREITNDDYAINVSPSNMVYSVAEQCKFVLNLLIEEEFEPIFNDEEVTIIYKKVYIEKPKLLNELTKIQEEIDNLQQKVLLSSTFDYSALLSKYDPVQLEKSIFKYCDAIKSTMEDLINMLSYFESEKNDMISEFNSIGLILSKKYENSSNLTAEENLLFEKRQLYFKKHFEIGMEDVRKQLLSIKNQAEQIEDRIDQINSGENTIRDLAILEKEERASFYLIVENAGNLIENALIKIEFFEANKEFASAAIRWWDQWTDDYKIFKTTLKEELKSSCEDENIEYEVYSVWYAEWVKKRLAIEERFLPLIDFGLKGHLIDCNGDDITTIEKVVQMLREYKVGVDRFYLEERKNIHQKFAFQVGGDLQEKLESESELYKLIANLQSELQNTIFSLSNAEDKLFLLKWAEVLLNLQIDEVLEFINDRELSSITNEILIEFSDLKQKNFETYISDSKAYSEEAQRREKEYNSLIFKMRKELMKQ